MSQTKAQLIDTLVASLLPASDSAVDIGSNAVRFANIYGDTLYGNGANLTGINTDLVSDTSPQLGGDLQSNGNDIDFADNDKAIFGTGTDLQIYHGGTNSIIQNSTGDLYFKNTNNLFIQVNDTEAAIYARPNAAVELYYDNSKKFNTNSEGVSVHGNLALNAADNYKIYLGASNDLQIYHDGSTSYIKDTGTGNLRLATSKGEFRNAADNENLAAFTENGAVELYYDNSKKFFTITNGVQATNRIIVGEGTAQRGLISGDANGCSAGAISDIPFTLIQNSLARCRVDGLNFQILNDNGKLQLGAAQDLEIYHNGSNSFINNNTGYLQIVSGGAFRARATSHVFNNSNDTENIIKGIENGAAELYYDGTKKLETTSTGVAITGEAALTGGALKLDSHPLVVTANFTDISGGSYAARLGSTGSSTIRSTQIYGGGGHIATFDGVNIRLGINETAPAAAIHITKPAHYVVTDSGKATNGIHVEGSAGNAGEFGGAISFSCGSADSSAAIAARQGGSDSDFTGLSIFTHPSGVAADDAVEKVRIHHSGEASFNDGICLGNGLTLASGNTMDDYEEGTWSPGGSWTTITAQYTKIGRMVYAGFSLRANASSGDVTISSLPFTSGDTHGHVGGIVWGLCEFNTTDSWLNGSIDDDSTTVTVRRGNATIVTFGSGNNNMNQNAFIRGMIIYMTA